MERYLLERYRRDRRRLLDFILSAGLASEVRPPPGAASLSDVDLDVVSADYVLERVKSGGVLDLSEASRRYCNDSEFPVMISSKSGSFFFLNLEPALSGPPPQRIPPQVGSDVNNCRTSHAAEKSEQLSGRKSAKSINTDDMRCGSEMFSSHQPSKERTILTFGLPVLGTGLSTDDMREAAYEMLLAAALFSGDVCVRATQANGAMKSHGESNIHVSEEHANMISEAMDACIKQGLMRLHARSTPPQIDVPHITANILEELLHCSVNLASKDEYESCRRSIAKLRDTIEGSFKMNLNQRAEILANIRRFFSRLSHVPGKFGLPGESCYWTSSYHVNIRLYQKLLFSVFDILEDGQIVEELEEFLSIFRLTWSMLGITERIHDVLYGSVLLQQ
ncbi:hypothetical protein Taro_009527, partial [Colocasia esculenta]|nr:hypothetical protein [Colocasia esculenta]